MTSLKKAPKKQARKTADKSDKETIDLTKETNDQQFDKSSAYFDEALSLPVPGVTEVGTIPKMKRKSGEVKQRTGIAWFDHNDQVYIRAKELMKGIKKRQLPEQIQEQQMELTTKLAEFEIVNDALNAAKTDVGIQQFSKIPSPTQGAIFKRQPNWHAHLTDVTSSGSQSAQFLKITKLANCMKHMNIEVHPHFLKEWYMETLPAQAAALGVKVIENSSLPNRVIAMTRTMPRELVGDKVQLSSPRSDSCRYLYVMAGSEAVPLLRARSLTAHLAGRARALHGQLTLLLLDTDNYFKEGKNAKNLELAITDFILTLDIDTILAKNADVLITTILQFTKAVAEEPAKLSKRSVDDEAGFYMRGDNTKCVTVDAQGNGLSRLWQQMLSVLPNSSLEVSRAITTHFPTPRKLVESLKSRAGVATLADVGVRRSAAPTGRARRLGPELALKLNNIFTTEDGEQAG